MDPKLSPEGHQERDLVDMAPEVATPASVDSSVSEAARVENGTEKPAVEQAEWTLQSSLQVLGGFMLLFNSYWPIGGVD